MNTVSCNAEAVSGSRGRTEVDINARVVVEVQDTVPNLKTRSQSLSPARAKYKTTPRASSNSPPSSKLSTFLEKYPNKSFKRRASITSLEDENSIKKFKATQVITPNLIPVKSNTSLSVAITSEEEDAISILGFISNISSDEDSSTEKIIDSELKTVIVKDNENELTVPESEDYDEEALLASSESDSRDEPVVKHKEDEIEENIFDNKLSSSEEKCDLVIDKISYNSEICEEKILKSGKCLAAQQKFTIKPISDINKDLPPNKIVESKTDIVSETDLSQPNLSYIPVIISTTKPATSEKYKPFGGLSNGPITVTVTNNKRIVDTEPDSTKKCLNFDISVNSEACKNNEPLSQVAENNNNNNFVAQCDENSKTLNLCRPTRPELEYISTDPKENEDNFHPEWGVLRCLDNDLDRYKALRQRWRNFCIPNPSVDLTYRHLRPDKINVPESSNFKLPQPVSSSSRGHQRTQSTCSSSTVTNMGRQRSKSCTSLYDSMIDTAEEEGFKEEERLRNQHNIELLQLANFQENQRRNLQYQTQRRNAYDQNVIFRQLMLDQMADLQALKCQQEQAVGNCRKKKQKEIDSYAYFRHEVRTFNAFYNGMDSTAGNHLELTEEQQEHLSETENMYKKFPSVYKPN